MWALALPLAFLALVCHALRRRWRRVVAWWDMRRRPRISTREGLVLRLLGDRERFGLDLIRESYGELKRGTVYVLLARMEDRGLISGSNVASENAGLLARRKYRATAVGAEALRRYLAPQLAEGDTFMYGGELRVYENGAFVCQHEQERVE